MLPVQNKWFVALVLGLLMTSKAFADGSPPLTHGLTTLTRPYVAPGLSLKNLDEDIVDLVSFKGKVVVINFWATWCPPCRREMGSLERLALATEDKGVIVLAVNVGEDADTVFSFLGTVEPSPSFPMLMDTAAKVVEQWKVRGLPTTYVVDPAGLVRYRAVGGREFDHPDLIKKILALH